MAPRRPSAAGQPHEDVFVGYGRYRKDHVGVLAARLLVPSARPQDIEAYSVLCVFGRMALKVFGVHRRPEITRVKPPEGEIVRVWPSHREVVDWPPLCGRSTSRRSTRRSCTSPSTGRSSTARFTTSGPDKKYKAKRRRTEGPGPRR